MLLDASIPAEIVGQLGRSSLVEGIVALLLVHAQHALVPHGNRRSSLPRSRRNQDNSIRATGAVEGRCRRSFEELNVLNVLRVEL